MYKITIWVFGLFLMVLLFYIAMFIGGDTLAHDATGILIGIFYNIFIVSMPFALVFYTIGWRNYRKRNLSKNKND